MTILRTSNTLIFFCLATGAVIAADVSVTMKPLRYCKDKKWWGCKTRGYPYGNYWENAGMSNDNQDKAFMAVMGTAPSNPKYIALFTSGQQGSSGGAAFGNVVSGATPNWRWNTNENGDESRSVDEDSVAAEFYNDQTRFLSRSDTLYLTLWDAQFNHMASSGEKEDTLEGYAKYIDSLVNWSNIEGIVMVGSSRGGCLVMRLSQELKSRYGLSTVQFALGSVDGVCKKSQSEFGTYSSTITNPTNSNYKAYKTDVSTELSGDKESYCVYHLALGQEVTGLALGVRTFTHETCAATGCELKDSQDEVWYKQDWDNICHTCAGQDFSQSNLDKTVTPMLDHLEDCKSRFGWS